MKSWQLLSILLLTTCAAPASTWLEVNQTAPYAGLLMERATAEHLATVAADYSIVLEQLNECQRQVSDERAKRTRWFRRPSVWIPVACATFTAGLIVGSRR